MKDRANSITNLIQSKHNYVTDQKNENYTRTTIGDLIVDLTDDARRFTHDDEESYEVVAYLLHARLNPHGRICGVAKASTASSRGGDGLTRLIAMRDFLEAIVRLGRARSRKEEFVGGSRNNPPAEGLK